MYNNEFQKFLNNNNNKIRLKKERQELMKILKKDFNYDVITKDEITDMIIDLELYNKQCEKKRNKK